MSRRRNGTKRAATALGINPYGWGNGGNKKRLKGTATPIETLNKSINDRITQK